jgi:UDP-N-acetylglucosamine acyltransferase
LIHHTAVINPRAEIDTDVAVGPYAVIGADVQIGRGSRVGPHAVIKGPSRIGENNSIYQFASLGDDPQDKKYKGEVTRLEVGNGNVFREYVSINRGTAQDRGVTRVGDDNWVMAYAHIAHDCQVGNGTVFANNASLAGHVTIEDFAVLGGFTLVHQFCAIGAYAFASFGSVISKDVPPYITVSGNPARAHGVNTEGLRRHGFGKESSERLRRAYKLLYRSGLTLEEALQQLRSAAREWPELARLVDFLVRQTRGIVR